MLKSAARKHFLDLRKNLSTSECLKLDDLLLIQWQRFNMPYLDCMGSFYPMEDKNEPNVLLLAKYVKTFVPHLTMAYPKINEDGISMKFYAETDTLSQNKWGIQEPLPFNEIEIQQMEVILVPLLGMDLKGNRIGYGKGFYDRYLANSPKTQLRVGISYFEPIERIQDTHEFDVPLTHCITPWKTYEF
jgi:5-formyltetrahydrofolate cyclo-ligase